MNCQLSLPAVLEPSPGPALRRQAAAALHVGLSLSPLPRQADPPRAGVCSHRDAWACCGSRPTRARADGLRTSPNGLTALATAGRVSRYETGIELSRASEKRKNIVQRARLLYLRLANARNPKREDFHPKRKTGQGPVFPCDSLSFPPVGPATEARLTTPTLP